MKNMAKYKKDRVKNIFSGKIRGHAIRNREIERKEKIVRNSLMFACYMIPWFLLGTVLYYGVC